MKADKIILGTVQFGLDYGINNPNGKATVSECLELLGEAYEGGVRYLDTAAQYGNAQEIIGEFHRNTKRRFFVNTKFKRTGAGDLSAQAEDSIRKLNIDSINIYFYHHFGDLISYPDTLRELECLKEEKIILKAGVSVYTNEELQIAIETDGIDTIQLPFNLLDNSFQRRSLLGLARKRKKEIQVRSVFLQGLLFKDPLTFPINLAPLKGYLEEVKKIARDASLSMQELAMAYVCSKKEIDQIIIGVDNAAQLNANLRLMDVSLSPEICEKIDHIAVAEVDLLYPYNWQLK